MARAVVANPFDNQIGSVASTANVVDIYQRGVVARSPFEALADSLKRFEAKATPALQRQEQRAAEKEMREGERLYQENRIAIGEAVKKGLIEEGASPYLRKGYRVSQLNTMATRYAAELESALVTQKLFHNGDPNKIESFIAGFQEKFVADNGFSEFADSEVAEFFGINANKANEVFRTSWREKHVAYQKEQNYLQFERDTAAMTTLLFREDMTDTEQAVAMEQLKEWIETQAKERSLDGMNNTRVTETIITGVSLAAELAGDADILDVLKETKLGTAAIGSSFKRQAEIMAVENRIAAKLQAQANTEYTKFVRDMKALRGKVSGEAHSLILSPDFSVPAVRALADQLFDTGVEENIAEATSILNFAEKVAEASNKVTLDPDDYLDIQSRLEKAGLAWQARAVLNTAAAAGKIDASHMRQFYGDWQSYYKPKDEDDDDPNALDFTTSTTTEGKALSAFKSVITGNEFDATSDNRINAIDASLQFRILWTETAQRMIQANDDKPLSFTQKIELEKIVTSALIERFMATAAIEVDSDAAQQSIANIVPTLPD